jgi:hypothetical protein
MPKELQTESKSRLEKQITTRMRTITIGSLAIIEEELIDNNDDIELKKVYDIMRKRILDLGNTQIRNIKEEMETYTIESNRYTVKLEMKPREGN